MIVQLEQRADLATKQWFDNYLKGAISYQGVKTPQVTSLVKDWYSSNQFKNYTPQAQLTLRQDLISSSYAEDKFAGTIYIQKYLLKKIVKEFLLTA